MFSQIFYLVRSKVDGSYLAAHPRPQNSSEEDDRPPSKGYLLLFREHADALSYLNTHGASVADRFGVESIPGSQLNGLMQRWGFQGLGMVQDPLIPRVEFLSQG